MKVVPRDLTFSFHRRTDGRGLMIPRDCHSLAPDRGPLNDPSVCSLKLRPRCLLLPSTAARVTSALLHFRFE